MITDNNLKLNDEELENVAGGAKGKTGKLEAYTKGVIPVFPDCTSWEKKRDANDHATHVEGKIIVSGSIKTCNWQKDWSMTEILEPTHGWVYWKDIQIIF